MHLASPRKHERDIGPIGTLSRIVAGAAAIVVPIALEGASWWDIGTVLLAFPLLSSAVAWLTTGVDQRAGDDGAACDGGLCSPRAFVLSAVMIGATIPLAILTPVHGDVAFWGWIGASMLLAAVRGYGGCEVLAFYNLLTGRRDQIGCLLFTPIDAAEARHRSGRTPIRREQLRPAFGPTRRPRRGAPR